MNALQEMVESNFEKRHQLDANYQDASLKEAIDTIINLLDQGKLRISEKIEGKWQVQQWVKKAILLYFRLQQTQVIPGSFTQYYDKIPLKYSDLSYSEFHKNNVRIVPPACARKGAYIAPGVILMPSYINIGAYVDSGAMIDTWATVGSCAQIGKNVHLSGGVGIGGVLEPLQTNPTIIEDNCFIGARSEIVEGVIVGEGAVISMGVYIGKSTKIYDREKDEISYGEIPPRSVVVPGNLPAKDGKYSLYCAVIVKQVDEETRKKISINELLRTSSFDLC
jgi:2,3,4,5-tetrahydropyridine-2,6-dicarboxylate N-succinyltransferase